MYLPDPHGKFIDWRAAECAFAFQRAHRPHIVIVGGDAVDFYQLSRFDKNPKRINDLQKDVDAAVRFLRLVRKHAPRARIEFLKGNHEDRMRRWSWGPGAGAHSLKCLQLPKLLELGDLGIGYHESGVLKVKNITFKHGDVVKKGAGNSARAEMEREGTSTCSGHTHRVGEVTRRTRGGFYKGVECGCLCQLNPEYGNGSVMDWAHGLGYGAFTDSGRFTLHTANIVNGKTFYGDRVIAAQ